MESTFACYYPAENPLFFSIDIKSTAWVDAFSDAIYMKLQMHDREVSRKELRLFKTDVLLDPDEDLQSRALQWLHQQPLDSQLKNTKRLASLFPQGPSRSDDKLDIIVADAEVLELVEGLGDPFDVYNRKVKKALNARLNRLCLTPSPSDIVHSHSRVAGLLGGSGPPIYLGRPGGAPATIFNPALATLQRHLEHLDQVQVSHVQVDHAAKYLQSAVKFYGGEVQREDAIEDLFNQAIGEKGEWQLILDWADKIRPDGSWWHDTFLIMVLELKNTLGLYGDALLQAIVDYSKVVAREKYKRFREFCNFPIVLVGLTANRLEISVAVCLGSIYVTKLLTLDLSLDFNASSNIISLARVFWALSHCLTDLKNYYNRVSKLASPKLSCLYPSPTLVDPFKALPKLTYRQFLSRTGQPASAPVEMGNTTTMYIATLNDTSREVIVKFTARYNETAHRLLAKAQLAPTLHFCERVIGNLYMVVMDRVDGKSVWQLQMDKTPVPLIVSKKVKEAICLLHENDFVFGDLRYPNILYTASEDSSESRVVLVDFDWPGKDGESRYPATLNLGIPWAADVLPYGIMRKAHDLWQVDQLTALCGPDA